MSRARRRDRRVYLASHPVVFALLAAARRMPVVRLGRVVLVQGTVAVTDALAHLPLDRVAAGTTGGAARAYVADGLLFDQDGPAHRGTRRAVTDHLGSTGVDRLRPVWTDILSRECKPLSNGGTVDVVRLAAELAGATACAMLDIGTDPQLVAQAALDAAAAVARGHLLALRRPGTARTATRVTTRLTDLLGAAGDESGLGAMLTVAAVNTTVAGLPRAVAWCADARLWSDVTSDGRLPLLVDELLRVVAPTPLLPRVAGANGTIDGYPVRRGDHLMLVSRHAVAAHRDDPDSICPAPPHIARLVFGTGPHACPGARLARAQFADTLWALAPYRPVVVRARADRRAALPGWRCLVIRAGDDT